jgi:general secretion pathway protein G
MNESRRDRLGVIPGSGVCAPGRGQARSFAFSLVELVIVIVIIGIIAAIAVPRFSGAKDAAQAKTVAATLKVINDAMELYKAENKHYPGVAADGSINADSVIAGNIFINEMVAPASGKPYLRGPGFPANPYNSIPNADRVSATLADPASSPGPVGWIANLKTGSFNINLWAISGPMSLCDLMDAAKPAAISYNHPGVADCP